MKKKILMLHSSSGLYGAENVIFNLCTSRNEMNYIPIIGSLENDIHFLSEFAKAALKIGIEVITIKSKGKFSISTINAIKKVIKEKDINIIHTHYAKATVIGFFVGKFCRIPVVETSHLYPPMPLNNLRLQIYAKIGAFFLRFIERTIAVSQKIKENLEKTGVPSNKIELIHNGIDVDLFNNIKSEYRDVFLKEIGFGENTFIVGAVGRLAEQKGHKYLLEAARQLTKINNKIKFVIAGDGPLKEKLNEEINRLGLNEHVKFIGFRSDIYKFYGALDIFLMPSIEEGLPMALLEAMAAGVPVIATSVGEIPKIIEDGKNGLMVKPMRSDLIYESIIKLYQNKNLLKKIGKEGKHTIISSYSRENMTKKYAKVYDDILKHDRLSDVWE